MTDVEFRAVDPEEFRRELEELLRQRQENKYAAQVGLKDAAFAVDHAQAAELGFAYPLPSLWDAEAALHQRVITPARLFEYDGTEHRVDIFEPRAVGFSGFMDCVTHSLALTDHGMFEVGRYPGLDIRDLQRHWSWFLHRRLATPEQMATWQAQTPLTPETLVDLFFEVVGGRPRKSAAERAQPGYPLRFRLGEVVQTYGAGEALQEAGQHPMDLIVRHITADWGELDDFDRRLNEEALRYGDRLFSIYQLTTGQELYCITEWDRSATTLLLPGDY
jgi:hypothetical protein